jgi:hypothetical protein
MAPSMLLSEAAIALALELKAVRRRQRYEAEQLRRDLGLVGSDRSLYGPMLNLKMFDYRLNFDGVVGVTHQLVRSWRRLKQAPPTCPST